METQVWKRGVEKLSAWTSDHVDANLIANVEKICWEKEVEIECDKTEQSNHVNQISRAIKLY